MNNRYEIIIYWEESDQLFVADVPELSGCMAHGKTEEDALAQVKESIALWIETALDSGEPVPKPKGSRLMYA